MNLPQVYPCSPTCPLGLLPNTSSQLTLAFGIVQVSPNMAGDPLGRPSAPAPSIQYCASNMDWRLLSYMILYMFQCHSPKSRHPLPLPQSP